MRQPLVSIIVTTKNSSRTLKKSLQSCLKQTYKPIELIVVDNYSSDKTVPIAKQYAKRVYNKGPERSTQRNYGVRKSHGEYVLFLDSDMSLSKHVVSECVTMIQKKEIKGIYIPEHITGSSFWTKVRNFERSFYNQTVIDAVRFMRKTDFIKVKGFDDTLYAAEDWDLDKRIRKLGKTTSINSSLYHDEHNFSLRNYIGKKGYYSENLKKYIAKWGGNDPDIQKQFGIFYRYFLVYIEQGKWKNIIRHPILFGGILFLKALIGFQYIRINEFKME